MIRLKLFDQLLQENRHLYCQILAVRTRSIGLLSAILFLQYACSQDPASSANTETSPTKIANTPQPTVEAEAIPSGSMQSSSVDQKKDDRVLFNERDDGTYKEQREVVTLSDQGSFNPEIKESGGRFLDFGTHQAYYTTFPSTFIPPDIASKAQLKRAKRLHYLNILVSPAGKYGGVPAAITGRQKNLMQQAAELTFKEIKEKDTVYYLAPFTIQGEDTLHFDLEFILPDGRKVSDSFSTKVYL